MGHAYARILINYQGQPVYDIVRKARLDACVALRMILSSANVIALHTMLMMAPSQHAYKPALKKILDVAVLD